MLRSPCVCHLMRRVRAKGNRLSEELHQVEIKRVFKPSTDGTAVLLGNDERTFLIFVGLYEAGALVRQTRGEGTARPLTHDLMQSVFLGFDIELKQVIISDIIDNAFCATLILDQKSNSDDKEWQGHRNEVRIDARPSDCLIMALKNNAGIFVTQKVLDQVPDFTHVLEEEGDESLFKLDSTKMGRDSFILNPDELSESQGSDDSKLGESEGGDQNSADGESNKDKRNKDDGE